MKKYKLIIISIKLLIVIIYIVILSIKLFYIDNIFTTEEFIQLDNKFFDYKQIYPQLSDIKKYNVKINKEINNLLSNDWVKWPETCLYNENNLIEKDDSWKIIPLYGFGIWCDEFKKKCPFLFKFLNRLDGLKIAIISKLKPHTKLEIHSGWGFHSNNVLRCHYGLKLPVNYYESFIGVKNNLDDETDEIQYHKLNEWIVFDDSKFHYAVNNSNSDRIVLIVDLERPFFIKKGNADNSSTGELIDFITEFKNRNADSCNKIPDEYLSLFH